MTRGAFTERTKRILMARCQGRCEKCGAPAVVKQFHHRRPRGMGGSRRDDTGSFSNALVLHASCHRWIEMNRDEAYKLGFLLRQHQNPSDTPVKLWDGWHYLTSDGSKANVVPNVDDAVDLDAVERRLQAVVAGPAADAAEDSPLADAEFDSGDVRGLA